MANLKEKYNNELRPALKEELGIDNICLLYTSDAADDC